MLKKKVVEIVRPVFCVVEQDKFPLKDRFKVAVRNKLVKDRIKIDGIEYTMTQVEPTTNGHALREYIAKHNAEHHVKAQAEQAARMAQLQEEQRRTRAIDRLRRDREAAKLAEARRRERQEGERRAAIILTEQAIMSRKMEEVETGQQCLPTNLLKPNRRLV